MMSAVASTWFMSSTTAVTCVSSTVSDWNDPARIVATRSPMRARNVLSGM